MTTPSNRRNKSHCKVTEQSPGQIHFTFSGDLTGKTLGPTWTQCIERMNKKHCKKVTVELSQVGVCDGAGIGLISYLANLAKKQKIPFEINGLRDELSGLLIYCLWTPRFF